MCTYIVLEGVKMHYIDKYHIGIKRDNDLII